MQDRICDYLKEQNRAVDVFELADALVLPVDAVSLALNELTANGLNHDQSNGVVS